MSRKDSIRHNPEDHDYDYTARRTFHLKMWTESHKRLKAMAVTLNLSMQEIMNELAERVGNGDNRVMKILTEYKDTKRTKQEKSLRGKVDMNDIYQAINDAEHCPSCGSKPLGDKCPTECG